MCWRLLFGSLSVCKKSTQEKWNPSTRRRRRRRSFPYKNKVGSERRKNLYMTKCSVRSTSIFLGRFGAVRRKMPFLEEQPEKGRSGHIWIRVLQGIIFVFIANLGQISRLQMLLLRRRRNSSCCTVSKNDHHDNVTRRKYWFSVLHAPIRIGFPMAFRVYNRKCN